MSTSPTLSDEKLEQIADNIFVRLYDNKNNPAGALKSLIALGRRTPYISYLIDLIKKETTVVNGQQGTSEQQYTKRSNGV